jgi:outer membrane lipoprotein-sorting protein
MRHCLPRSVLGSLALVALLSAPASAQFRWPWESAPEPAPAEPAAPAAKPAAPAAPATRLGQTTDVLPPRRPPNLPGSGATDVAEATPMRISPAAMPADGAPMSDREIVARANAYFNGISTLVGDFVQTSADGRRIGGKLYLQRPGRLRFAYEQPSNLEVVADGRSVAVRDRKLATQDLYLIGQTPLKFLLRENLDLSRDVRILEAAQEADGVRLSLEDRSTLGGTSKITLYFDRNLEALRRWRVIDPQGFQTTVALSNLDRDRRVDPGLFVINYERMLGDSTSR